MSEKKTVRLSEQEKPQLAKEIVRREFWERITKQSDEFVDLLEDILSVYKSPELHENDLAVFKKILFGAKDIQALASVAYISRLDDLVRNVYRPELKAMDVSSPVDLSKED